MDIKIYKLKVNFLAESKINRKNYLSILQSTFLRITTSIITIRLFKIPIKEDLLRNSLICWVIKIIIGDSLSLHKINLKEILLSIKMIWMTKKKMEMWSLFSRNELTLKMLIKSKKHLEMIKLQVIKSKNLLWDQESLLTLKNHLRSWIINWINLSKEPI